MHARCAICSDLFDFIQDVAATLCGHIFHTTCLSQWLQQSKTCPQCRLKVTRDKVIYKLYFDTEDQGSDDENANSNNNVQLLNQVESCKADLAASNREKIELLRKIDEFEDTIKLLNAEKQSAQTALWETKKHNKIFISQLQNMETLKNNNAEMKGELSELRKKMSGFQNLKTIAENATKDVEEMINKCQYKPQVGEVLKWHSVVRRELIKSDEERQKLKTKLEKSQREKKELEKEVIEYESRICDMENELKFREEERENLKNSKHSAEFDAKSPKLTPNSPVFNRPFMQSPKIVGRKYSNNDEWIALSPEILPDKLTNTKSIINKRENPSLRGSLRITSKRHMSDSSVPTRLKSNDFHFNGLGGCSKFEVPFRKAKAPKLTSLDNYVTLD